LTSLISGTEEVAAVIDLHVAEIHILLIRVNGRFPSQGLRFTKCSGNERRTDATCLPYARARVNNQHARDRQLHLFKSRS
jgi:hypothetical protein